MMLNTFLCERRIVAPLAKSEAAQTTDVSPQPATLPWSLRTFTIVAAVPVVEIALRTTERTHVDELVPEAAGQT